MKLHTTYYNKYIEKSNNLLNVLMLHDGKQEYYYTDICFARIPKLKQITEMFFPFSQRGKGNWYSSPLFWKYIKYIITESIYKDCFLNHSVQSVVGLKGVYLNCDKSYSELISACCAIRQGWEQKGLCEAFVYLCDKGVHPFLSFIACNKMYGFSVKSTGKVIFNLQLAGNHSPFGRILSVEGLKMLVKEGVHVFDKSVKEIGNPRRYEVFKTSRTVAGSWDDSTDTLFNKDYRVSEGEGWNRKEFWEVEKLIDCWKKLEKEIGL